MPNESLDFAKGRLPYASELFGTYRPMIGWASKRKTDRITRDLTQSLSPLLKGILAKYVTGNRYGGPPDDRHVEEFDLGRLATVSRPRVTPADSGTFLIPELQRIILERLGDRPIPTSPDEWRELVNDETVREAYGNTDLGAIGAWFRWSNELWNANPARAGESPSAHAKRIFDLMYAVIDRESRLGAALIDLANTGAIEVLSSLLFVPAPDAETILEQFKALQEKLNDPFLNFDPRDGLSGVSVSPLGIVHYFRQYFFELDTFLGPAVGHVWLTPGSTVELIESSTRRTVVEQTVEIEQESTMRRESEDKRQEDVSDGVKQENKSDSKLGFSTTVNQSWPTGDATATGSFNLDTTQSEARDTTYKRMREQTEKISHGDPVELQVDVQDHHREHRRLQQALRDQQPRHGAPELRAPPQDAQGGGPGPGHRDLPVLGDVRRRPRPRARPRQPGPHRQAARHHPAALPHRPADAGTEARHPVRRQGLLGGRGPAASDAG